MTTIDAAKRLRAGWKGSVAEAILNAHLDAALAAERRATVERIREGLASLNWLTASEADVTAILDAEAER